MDKIALYEKFDEFVGTDLNTKGDKMNEMLKDLWESIAEAVDSAKTTLQPLLTSLPELLQVQAKLTEIEAVYANMANIDIVAADTVAINVLATYINELKAIYDQIDKLLQLLENLGTYETVAGITNEIQGVYTNLTAITDVAAKLVEIGAVYNDLAKIGGVHSKLTEVEAVADNMAALLAVKDNETNINIVAEDINLGAGSKLAIVAADIADVTTVATNIADVNLTASKMAEIEAAPGAATDAATARDKAEEWAEKAEDVEVETGKYSAKHHAAKAEATNDSTQALLANFFDPSVIALSERAVSESATVAVKLRYVQEWLDELAAAGTQPTLAMMPAVFKAAKLYSVLPSNGSGDLTVARNSEAVALIEGIPTTVAANVPVIDMVNGVGSTRTAAAMTNRIARFLDFTNVFWSKSAATVDNNGGSKYVDPTGGSNAYKLIEDNTNARHFISLASNISITTGTVVTALIIAKASERGWIYLYDNSATQGYAYFDLVNGVVGATKGTTVTAVIRLLSNGYYACSITYPIENNTCTLRCSIALGNNSLLYQGVTGNGVFIYNANLADGTLTRPVSVNPALDGSSVTRLADMVSKSGIATLIGQTEGTLFADITISADIAGDRTILDLYTSNSQFIQLVLGSDKKITFLVINTANQAVIKAGTNYQLTRYKIAAAYKENDFVLYVNGTQIGTDNSGTVPPTAIVSLGKYGGASSSLLLNDNINKAWISKTRLSNAELATLTTL